MASEGGSAADGKPSTIRWRSDVQDNSRTTGQHRATTTASASSSTTAGGAGGGGRRKWSLRGAGRRGSGDGRGGRGGGSALLGHLDDDDLDSDLFDDELDFRHQHDTTSVLFLSPSIPLSLLLSLQAFVAMRHCNPEGAPPRGLGDFFC